MPGEPAQFPRAAGVIAQIVVGLIVLALALAYPVFFVVVVLLLVGRLAHALTADR